MDFPIIRHFQSKPTQTNVILHIFKWNSIDQKATIEKAVPFDVDNIIR